MSTKSNGNGPGKWSLPDVEAPAPQTDVPLKPPTMTKAQAAKGNTATHTGTDPLGRAIGPKEDPAKIKKVRDPETGKVVTPDRETGEVPSQKEAREKAEAAAAEDPAAKRAEAADKIAQDALGTSPDDVLDGLKAD